MTERATIDQTSAAQAPQPEDACPCGCNREASQQLFDTMPDEELLYDLADLFKIFGDSTRIKILYALLRSELCVCDIADLLGLTQSAISHQLRVLRSSKLVKFRRDGKTLYYSLADEHVCRIISQGMEHVEE